MDVRADVGEDVQKQGMEIVGCPIGSDRFCKNFIKKTLKTMLAHNNDLKQIHPQAASKLLLNCVASAPGYLAQVCNPALIKDYLINFDDDLWKLWTLVLGGVGPAQEQLAEEGRIRSRSWTTLPARLGGAAGLLRRTTHGTARSQSVRRFRTWISNVVVRF